MAETAAGRLRMMLTAGPSSSSGEDGWSDFESNPFVDDASDSELELTGDDVSPNDEDALLSLTPETADDGVLTLDVDPPETGDATAGGDSRVGPPADDTGDATRAGVIEFHTAVSTAREEAEAALTTYLERLRTEAEDRHAEEVARLNERHAEELSQACETREAEVTERVRREEATRYAAASARLRETLEAQHADDLQRVRATAVDSFKALTGRIAQPPKA